MRKEDSRMMRRTEKRVMVLAVVFALITGLAWGIEAFADIGTDLAITELVIAIELNTVASETNEVGVLSDMEPGYCDNHANHLVPAVDNSLVDHGANTFWANFNHLLINDDHGWSSGDVYNVANTRSVVGNHGSDFDGTADYGLSVGNGNFYDAGDRNGANFFDLDHNLPEVIDLRRQDPRHQRLVPLPS